MGVFKSQFSRALSVIPSDYASIPYPAIVTSGISTYGGEGQLVSESASFITAGVAVGDILYNTTSKISATIISIISETELYMNANAINDSDQEFVIYQASQQTGIGNTGCFIYVGGGGNVSVTTIGGDVVLFNNVPEGTVLPVQVIAVNQSLGGTTTADFINALW